MATSAPAALRKTALNAVHRRSGAKMVDFGGWDMPVEYSGLIAEHMAVRTGVGLFDVSHMGDIQLRGPESLAAVQQFSMNDASKLQVGQAQYSAMLYPNGTFVDDVIVHKLSDNDYLIVINAGTREKDYQWIRTQAQKFHCHVSDYSDYYTQLAIQGPRAAETLAKLTNVDLSTVKNYWFTYGTVCGLPNTLIARTGYTGEDGFEIYVPSDEATSERVWNEVLEAGKEFGIIPCGLGARNTLRLESAMALYGHEISETINVFEAGLGRYAKLEKGPFTGSEALEKINAEGGPQRKLVGLEMIERGIARDGYPVLDASGVKIGEVTSGSPSPFLKKNIALAYVPVELAQMDGEVAVEIRGNAVKARIVPTPFYRRPKKQA
ncbi:glycine cleavage system aminomethyltransferase GcvT [Silvibacterium dinghuense]|uniref:Aminomethyltransferase n=1 Tax=Silvibacterium dinghuense TaxID=1560006 RepID=A0A4Q1S9Q4_9BACT|nr:glycine cleavage system aminomethyltransferase GcvT [Silvibacterium dinghuense]RXS93396.1 glycine cleavage system aminomethyltransferase GcvT [Silvibacterium dinghuense]GGH05465.1 aminomethyltransferase [Silvibacterium dinghuense]